MSAKVLTVPGAPLITAVVTTHTTMTVSFAAPSSNGRATITAYKYSTNNGANWYLRTTGSTTTSLLNIRLTAATSYLVKLSAVHSVGQCLASNVVRVSTT